MQKFINCFSLKSIKLPESLEVLEPHTFSWCFALTSITLPNTLKIIDNYAFSECASLSEIILPSSINNIGLEAFASCSALNKIQNKSAVPSECHRHAFSSNQYESTTLYVPIGAWEAYNMVEPWRNFWNIEEMGFGDIYEVEADDNVHVLVENDVLSIGGIGNNVKITIYDMQGRIVYSGFNSTITGLVSGFYIVKVEDKTIKVAI